MDALAIADDLTGAMEVGARFRASGLRTVVVAEAHASLDEHVTQNDALVINTNSRHLPAGKAACRVRSLAHVAQQLRIAHLYKKTDSTLRGNIAAEFQALLDVYPALPLVYVPAYPGQGRTVFGGVLYVNGRRLEETSPDPLEAARESSILRLLTAGGITRTLWAANAKQLSELLRDAPGGTVIVCDGCTDADLQDTARALEKRGTPCLVAGTGGFSGYWSRPLPVSPVQPPGLPSVRHWLAVVGSLHANSREQLAAANEWVQLDLPPDEGGDDMLVARAATACAEHRNCALLTPAARLAAPLELPVRIGRLVRLLLGRVPFDGLAIFGGDTASGVLRVLGCTFIEPFGEVLPGIPVCSIRPGGAREIVLVTKAGGFGPVDILPVLSMRFTADKPGPA